MTEELRKLIHERGEPLRGQPTRVGPIGAYGIIYEYPDYGMKRSIRYYSTSDEALLKAAVLMLVCSDLGFQVLIDDTAYKTNQKVKLAVGRGQQWSGAFTPDHDFWVSVDDGDKEVFATPEAAVARFFEVWKQMEVGDYWVDANFSGHGCPMSAFEEDDDDDGSQDESGNGGDAPH